MNEAIVGQLFAIFKEQYGYAVDDAAGVFDGQRDMLEFLMRLGKSLERNERAGTRARKHLVDRFSPPVDEEANCHLS